MACFKTSRKSLKSSSSPALSSSWPAERDPHLVVVPVRILALALVVAQVVPRGETIVNRDLEHAFPWQPVVTDPRQLHDYSSAFEENDGG